MSQPLNENDSDAFAHFKSIDNKTSLEIINSEYYFGLPEETKLMAHQFIDICNRHKIFNSDLECKVSSMWKGDIMFDWNNGEIPVLTTVISSSSPKFVFSVKLRDKKLSGEDETIDFADPVIAEFAKELGIKKCQNSTTLDSLSKRANGKERVASQASIHQIKRYGSLSSVQQNANARKYCKQENTSHISARKAIYVVGTTQVMSNSEQTA